MKKIILTAIYLLLSTMLSQAEFLVDDLMYAKSSIFKSHKEEDIVKGNLDSLFVPYSFENTASRAKNSFWIKFKINPKSKYDDVIFAPFVSYNKIVLYYLKNDSIKSCKSGFDYAFDERTVKIRDIILPLPKKPLEYTYYVYIENFLPNKIHFSLVDSIDVMEDTFIELQIDMFLFGLSALSILISLLLLLYFRESIYFYYCIFAFAILFGRFVDSGFIYNYKILSEAENLYLLYNVYSLVATAIVVSSVLYLIHFVNLKIYAPKIYRFFIVIVSIRILVAGIKILNPRLNFFDSYIDLAIQLMCLFAIIYSIQFKKRIGILALLSSSIICFASYIQLFGTSIFNVEYSWKYFILVSNFEVVIFCISIIYRYFLESKEKQYLLVDMNNALEVQVEERTKQISIQAEEIKKMNAILLQNNISLEQEVKETSKARLLQKSMSFNEFQEYFPDTETCLKYLSDVKWPSDGKFKCVKCGYNDYKLQPNISRKCKKCNHIESPTVNTLFAKVKFPLPKAFYITYITSLGDSTSSLEDHANNLDLRTATFWTFKQKVQDLMSRTKTIKKHKDGWTHLIKYSIEANKLK